MRIAIVRQRYNPFGGAERFVERALAALGGQAVEVTLIARGWEGSAEAGDRYRLHRCDPFFMGRVWRDWSFARCARRAMAAGGFDITQAHERIPGCQVFRAGDGVHAAWLDHLGRARGAFGRFGLAVNPYHRYTLAAERAMFADPALEAVICNSRLVRDEIVRHFGVADASLHVIYNGVDLDAFHPRLAAGHRSALRTKIGVANDAPLFVYVGNGFERKGVPRLIEAAARMANREARFAIVGGDRKLDAAKRQAVRLGVAERFHFAGPQRDVKPWYGAADAFVLPTLYDPFPNAALEALACGLPVVTSTACGTAELIEDGRNGCVCDALDIAALADRLDRLAAPGAAAAMRDAARATAEPLSIAAMTTELVALYARLSGHVAARQRRPAPSPQPRIR